MNTHVTNQGIIIGDKDVDPQAPSHVAGVHEGNWPMRIRRTAGIRRRQPRRYDEDSRSTGINPEKHVPTHPSMPKLTPP